MEKWSFRGNLDFNANQGTVLVESPSNIALTKYWGKHGNQLPQNPSISFTLSNAKTTTKLGFTRVEDNSGGQVELLFEGREQPVFLEKIIRFFDKNQKHFPYFKNGNWKIQSKNSFPHSSGIASSASSMSALMWALCQIENRFLNSSSTDDELSIRASFLSRLASGSASRSIFAGAALWGNHGEIPGSSDLFAIPMNQNLHQEFANYHDDILIVSKEEKSVSSTAGHQLMEHNIYASTRFQQAADNTLKMVEILKNGDINSFVDLVEHEALTLHALMMTSSPSYILMKPETLVVIQSIQSFREKTKTPICFTLDAGPNIHILYPHQYAEVCQDFIQNQLLSLVNNGSVLQDQLGEGTKLISS